MLNTSAYIQNQTFTLPLTYSSCYAIVASSLLTQVEYFGYEGVWAKSLSEFSVAVSGYNTRVSCITIGF